MKKDSTTSLSQSQSGIVIPTARHVDEFYSPRSLDSATLETGALSFSVAPSLTGIPAQRTVSRTRGEREPSLATKPQISSSGRVTFTLPSRPHNNASHTPRSALTQPHTLTLPHTDIVETPGDVYCVSELRDVRGRAVHRASGELSVTHLSSHHTPHTRVTQRSLWGADDAQDSLAAVEARERARLAQQARESEEQRERERERAAAERERQQMVKMKSVNTLFGKSLTIRDVSLAVKKRLTEKLLSERSSESCVATEGEGVSESENAKKERERAFEEELEALVEKELQAMIEKEMEKNTERDTQRETEREMQNGSEQKRDHTPLNMRAHTTDSLRSSLSLPLSDVSQLSAAPPPRFRWKDTLTRSHSQSARAPSPPLHDAQSVSLNDEEQSEVLTEIADSLVDLTLSKVRDKLHTLSSYIHGHTGRKLAANWNMIEQRFRGSSLGKPGLAVDANGLSHSVRIPCMFPSSLYLLLCSAKVKVSYNELNTMCEVLSVSERERQIAREIAALNHILSLSTELREELSAPYRARLQALLVEEHTLISIEDLMRFVFSSEPEKRERELAELRANRTQEVALLMEEKKKKEEQKATQEKRRAKLIEDFEKILEQIQLFKGTLTKLRLDQFIALIAFCAEKVREFHEDISAKIPADIVFFLGMDAFPEEIQDKMRQREERKRQHHHRVAESVSERKGNENESVSSTGENAGNASLLALNNYWDNEGQPPDSVTCAKLLGPPHMITALREMVGLGLTFPGLSYREAVEILQYIAVSKIAAAGRGFNKRWRYSAAREKWRAIDRRRMSTSFGEWKSVVRFVLDMREKVMRKVVAWRYYTLCCKRRRELFRCTFWPLYTWRKFAVQNRVAKEKSKFLVGRVMPTLTIMRVFRAWRGSVRDDIRNNKLAVKYNAKITKRFGEKLLQWWMHWAHVRRQIRRAWHRRGKHLRREVLMERKRQIFLVWRVFSHIKRYTRIRAKSLFYEIKLSLLAQRKPLHKLSLTEKRLMGSKKRKTTKKKKKAKAAKDALEENATSVTRKMTKAAINARYNGSDSDSSRSSISGGLSSQLSKRKAAEKKKRNAQREAELAFARHSQCLEEIQKRKRLRFTWRKRVEELRNWWDCDSEREDESDLPLSLSQAYERCVESSESHHFVTSEEVREMLLCGGDVLLLSEESESERHTLSVSDTHTGGEELTPHDAHKQESGVSLTQQSHTPFTHNTEDDVDTHNALTQSTHTSHTSQDIHTTQTHTQQPPHTHHTHKPRTGSTLHLLHDTDYLTHKIQSILRGYHFRDAWNLYDGVWRFHRVAWLALQNLRNYAILRRSAKQFLSQKQFFIKQTLFGVWKEYLAHRKSILSAASQVLEDGTKVLSCEQLTHDLREQHAHKMSRTRRFKSELKEHEAKQQALFAEASAKHGGSNGYESDDEVRHDKAMKSLNLIADDDDAYLAEQERQRLQRRETVQNLRKLMEKQEEENSNNAFQRPDPLEIDREDRERELAIVEEMVKFSVRVRETSHSVTVMTDKEIELCERHLRKHEELVSELLDKETLVTLRAVANQEAYAAMFKVHAANLLISVLSGVHHEVQAQLAKDECRVFFRALRMPWLIARSTHMLHRKQLKNRLRLCARLCAIQRKAPFYRDIRTKWVLFNKWLQFVERHKLAPTPGLVARIQRKVALHPAFHNILKERGFQDQAYANSENGREIERSLSDHRALFSRWKMYTQECVVFSILHKMVWARFRVKTLRRCFFALKTGLGCEAYFDRVLAREKERDFTPPCLRRIQEDIDQVVKRFVPLRRTQLPHTIATHNRRVVREWKSSGRTAQSFKRFFHAFLAQTNARIGAEQRLLYEAFENRGELLYEDRPYPSSLANPSVPVIMTKLEAKAFADPRVADLSLPENEHTRAGCLPSGFRLTKLRFAMSFVGGNNNSSGGGSGGAHPVGNGSTHPGGSAPTLQQSTLLGWQLVWSGDGVRERESPQRGAHWHGAGVTIIEIAVPRDDFVTGIEYLYDGPVTVAVRVRFFLNGQSRWVGGKNSLSTLSVSLIASDVEKDVCESTAEEVQDRDRERDITEVVLSSRPHTPLTQHSQPPHNALTQHSQHITKNKHPNRDWTKIRTETRAERRNPALPKYYVIGLSGLLYNGRTTCIGLVVRCVATHSLFSYHWVGDRLRITRLDHDVSDNVAMSVSVGGNRAVAGDAQSVPKSVTVDRPIALTHAAHAQNAPHNALTQPPPRPSEGLADDSLTLSLPALHSHVHQRDDPHDALHASTDDLDDFIGLSVSLSQSLDESESDTKHDNGEDFDNNNNRQDPESRNNTKNRPLAEGDTSAEEEENEEEQNGPNGTPNGSPNGKVDGKTHAALTRKFRRWRRGLDTTEAEPLTSSEVQFFDVLRMRLTELGAARERATAFAQRLWGAHDALTQRDPALRHLLTLRVVAGLTQWLHNALSHSLVPLCLTEKQGSLSCKKAKRLTIRAKTLSNQSKSAFYEARLMETAIHPWTGKPLLGPAERALKRTHAARIEEIRENARKMEIQASDMLHEATRLARLGERLLPHIPLTQSLYNNFKTKVSAARHKESLLERMSLQEIKNGLFGANKRESLLNREQMDAIHASLRERKIALRDRDSLSRMVDELLCDERERERDRERRETHSHNARSQRAHTTSRSQKHLLGSGNSFTSTTTEGVLPGVIAALPSQRSHTSSRLSLDSLSRSLSLSQPLATPKNAIVVPKKRVSSSSFSSKPNRGDKSKVSQKVQFRENNGEEEVPEEVRPDMSVSLPPLVAPPSLSLSVSVSMPSLSLSEKERRVRETQRVTEREREGDDNSTIPDLQSLHAPSLSPQSSVRGKSRATSRGNKRRK